MLIELAGLPGSGKTTVARPILRTLRGEGYILDRFDAAAFRGGKAARKSIRMLVRKPERAGLYGMARFAAAFPQVHRTLMDGAEGSDDRTIWSMQFMSDAHYALEDMARGTTTFSDEGFVQYGIAALAQLVGDDPQAPGWGDGIAAYAAAIPRPDLILAPDIAPDMALARTAIGNNKLPNDLKRATHEARLALLETRRGVLDALLGALEGLGARIVRLDATLHPEVLIEQGLVAARALLGAPTGPPIPPDSKKKRARPDGKPVKTGDLTPDQTVSLPSDTE